MKLENLRKERLKVTLVFKKAPAKLFAFKVDFGEISRESSASAKRATGVNDLPANPAIDAAALALVRACLLHECQFKGEIPWAVLRGGPGTPTWTLGGVLRDTAVDRLKWAKNVFGITSEGQTDRITLWQCLRLHEITENGRVVTREIHFNPLACPQGNLTVLVLGREMKPATIKELRKVELALMGRIKDQLVLPSEIMGSGRNGAEKAAGSVNGRGKLGEHDGKSLDRPAELDRGGWITYSHPPPTASQKKYYHEIESEIEALRTSTRARAEDRALQNMVNAMGQLTERFGAASSYLFVRDCAAVGEPPYIRSGTRLKLRLDHNTGVRSDAKPTALPRVAKLTDQGITGHVAVTSRPFLTNNVSEVRFYKKSVSATRSELAVPILHSDEEGDDHVIGVLNLESNRSGAFLEAQKGELMAAASKLAPEILVLHYLETHKRSFGWHPGIDGWSIDALLEDFCASVAGRRKGAGHRIVHEHLPRPSCTVWYHDPEPGSGELRVLATARFDYEYINRQTLPANRSFTGLVSMCKKGAVLFGPTSEIGAFLRIQKSLDMGMVYAFAAPIYLPGLQPASNALGALNLYFFREELPESVRDDTAKLNSLIKARFPRRLVERLANQVGELISECHALRAECAAAQMRHLLYEQAVLGLTEFETAKEAILRCFEADYCSLFVREDTGLRCVSSTGLRSRDGVIVNAFEASYDLNNPEDQGLSVYLATERNQVVRIRSPIEISGELGRKKPHPVNKFMETFSHADTEHRPLLGISVDDPSGRIQPVGVIRVLRKSGAKPFSHFDADVLKRLGHELFQFFSNWHTDARRHLRHHSLLCAARFPFSVRLIHQSPAPLKLDAIDRLGAALPPNAIWNRRWVSSVLVDLLSVYRSDVRTNGWHGGLIASFRMFNPLRESDIPERYRIFAIHRIRCSDPPTEDDIRQHVSPGESIGQIAVRHNRPITFDREKCKIFRKVLPESDQVKSGVCMPVRYLGQQGVVWGVLSVDSDEMMLKDWRSEHLEVVALAAKKLDFTGRDNSFHDGTVYDGERWIDMFKIFINRALPNAGVHLASIVTKEGTHLPILTTPSQASALETAMQSCTETPLPDVEDVKCSQAGAFRMALWFGAFKTELTLLGVIDRARLGIPRHPPSSAVDADTLRENFFSKIVEVSHLWNRFVSSRPTGNVTPLFSVSFRQQSQADEGCIEGLTFWVPQVRLGQTVLE